MEETVTQARPRQQSPRSSIGVWLHIPLVIGFLMIFILSMQWKETLIVQRVVVEGARIMSAKELVALANIQPQALMYQTDLFAVRQRLYSQPLIKSAIVSRQLPNELYISIVERDPIAALSGSQLYCIDAEGMVLPHRVSTTTFDLPLVDGVAGAESVRVGTAMNQSDVFEAIDILQIAQRTDLYHVISEVNMNKGGEVVLYSTEGGIPITLGRGDFGKKLVLFQSFLMGYGKPNMLQQLRAVDLRYDGQVVAKWDRQKESLMKVPS